MNEHNNTYFNNGIFEFHCDIIRAIETLSRSRAAGIEGMPSKIYRHNVDHPIILKLKNAFDEWIQNSNTPDYFMKGRLVLISKIKSNTPEINDTRPISVLPAITKFFETSILHNLEQLIISPAFSKNQREFTKGKSTLDNIKEVIEIARQLRDSKAKI